MTNCLQNKRPQKKNSPKKRIDGTIPMFILAMLLIFIGAEIAPAAYGNIPNRYPILAACTRFEYDNFKSVDWNRYEYPEVTTISDVSLWMNQYHENVGEVVTEALGGNGEPPRCTASSYEEMLPLTGKLGQLAATLPSWHSLTWQLPPNDIATDDFDSDPELINSNLSSLSQLDVGTVLLEYLQMYECALVERSLFLARDTYKQEQGREKKLISLKNGAAGDVLEALVRILKRRPLEWGRYINFVIGDRQIILQELTIARRSLERTLTFLSGFNHLRPIDMELTCLQQASLDVRNGLALAADASSCLPRVWNNKDVLRDYK
ncbi:hypothetical protein KKF55_00630 [Patescibacteria group bacterium]|nr:hypothetical protein [Patescibacteria group bacterium]